MSGARGPEAFGEISRRYLDEGAFAGSVLRVEAAARGGRPGRLIYEEAWGLALKTEGESLPLETSTIFDLASVSKLFTATAALRLVSQGRLSLDTRAADCLCADGLLEGSLASRLSASLGKVDVRALLSHSSGIHYWYPFYTRKGEGFEAILADVLEEHPRAGKVIYSDLNFMILGRMIERITRLSLPLAVADLVFRPLGLERSSYGRPLGPSAAGEFGNRIERAMVADLGLSFDGWRDESRPIVAESDDGNCYYYFGGAAGHAGVFSDARDLCRLGRCYLEGGMSDPGNGRPREALLSPGLAEAAMSDQGGERGLGFQLGENYPGGGCGHTGFTGSYLHLSASSGLAIAILANRLHVAEPRNINPYRKELSEAVLAAFA